MRTAALFAALNVTLTGDGFLFLVSTNVNRFVLVLRKRPDRIIRSILYKRDSSQRSGPNVATS